MCEGILVIELEVFRSVKVAIFIRGSDVIV